MLPQAAGEQDHSTVGRTHAGYSHAGGRPRKRARGGVGHRREQVNRAFAPPARISRESAMPLPRRHGNEIRSDARRNHGSRAQCAVRRREFHDIALTDSKLFRGVVA